MADLLEENYVLSSDSEGQDYDNDAQHAFDQDAASSSEVETQGNADADDDPSTSLSTPSTDPISTSISKKPPQELTAAQLDKKRKHKQVLSEKKSVKKVKFETEKQELASCWADRSKALDKFNALMRDSLKLTSIEQDSLCLECTHPTHLHTI